MPRPNKRNELCISWSWVQIPLPALSLEASFNPRTLPKPQQEAKSNHQQDLALDVYANPAGLKFATAQAKSIGGLLALGRFAWQEFLHPSTSTQGDAPSPDETEPLLPLVREVSYL